MTRHRLAPVAPGAIGARAHALAASVRPAPGAATIAVMVDASRSSAEEQARGVGDAARAMVRSNRTFRVSGASPGRLPVPRSTKYQYIVNLRTARVLGIVVPRSLPLQASEVTR